MSKRILRTGISVVIYSAVSIFSNSLIAQESIADAQRAQIQTLLAGMNQNAKDVADTVISEPQNAIDAGCLSDVQGIDLSVFTVDFTNIWGVIYNTLKDQILNQVCTAASDWVNSQNADLDSTLQLPFGLGSAGLSQGTALNDWQSALSTDVEMDSTEIATQVTTDTLGQVPPPGVIRGAVKKASGNQTTPGHDKEAWESQIQDALDVKELWNED